MPDMIFTVLFFFMIVTNMREVKPKVEYQVPRAGGLERLVNKSAVTYIYIGRPAGASSSSAAERNSGALPADGTVAGDVNGADGQMVIQMNDRLVSVADIVKYLREERSRMSPEDAARMTVNIKADKDTPMGIINDVKQALREADVLNIVYSAEKETSTSSVVPR